jgi:hypothetical protein
MYKVTDKAEELASAATASADAEYQKAVAQLTQTVSQNKYSKGFGKLTEAQMDSVQEKVAGMKEFVEAQTKYDSKVEEIANELKKVKDEELTKFEEAGRAFKDAQKEAEILYSAQTRAAGSNTYSDKNWKELKTGKVDVKRKEYGEVEEPSLDLRTFESGAGKTEVTSTTGKVSKKKVRDLTQKELEPYQFDISKMEAEALGINLEGEKAKIPKLLGEKEKEIEGLKQLLNDLEEQSQLYTEATGNVRKRQFPRGPRTAGETYIDTGGKLPEGVSTKTNKQLIQEGKLVPGLRSEGEPSGLRDVTKLLTGTAIVGGTGLALAGTAKADTQLEDLNKTIVTGNETGEDIQRQQLTSLLSLLDKLDNLKTTLEPLAEQSVAPTAPTTEEEAGITQRPGLAPQVKKEDKGLQWYADAKTATGEKPLADEMGKAQDVSGSLGNLLTLQSDFSKTSNMFMQMILDLPRFVKIIQDIMGSMQMFSGMGSWFSGLFNFASGGKIKRMAGGGRTVANFPGRKDSMLTMTQPGEYVVPRNSTDIMGEKLMTRIREGKFGNNDRNARTGKYMNTDLLAKMNAQQQPGNTFVINATDAQSFVRMLATREAQDMVANVVTGKFSHNNGMRKTINRGH